MGNKLGIQVSCLTVLITLVGCAGAAANEPAKEQQQLLILTLDDAIQMALERNYAVQVAEAQVREAEAAYGQAAAPNRFQMNFEGAYLRLGPVTSLEVPTPTGPETMELGTDQTWNYGASAYKSLYSAGRNQSLRALARLGLSTAELNVASQRHQIALAATELFYAVSQTEGLLAVAQQDEERAQEQLRVATARVKAGAAPQFDLLRAEVAAANVHQSVISAQTAVETVNNRLKNLLALDVAQPIEIQPHEEVARISPDPYACRQLALQQREEIKIARQQVAMAEQSVRLARATRGLNLGAVGSYTRQKASGFADDYSWSLGVQASKPILDGGSSRSQQRQAEEQLKQVRLFAQQITELVALDVWQAVLALEEAQAKLASTDKTIEQAEEGLRLAQLRYKAGVGTTLEITDARTALTVAETNHVNAIYSYQIAEARLARAVGVPTAELP